MKTETIQRWTLLVLAIAALFCAINIFMLQNRVTKLEHAIKR